MDCKQATVKQAEQRHDKGQVYALVTELMAYDSIGNELKDKHAINENKGSWADIKDEVARKIQVNSKGGIYVLKYDSTIEIFDPKLQSINILGIDQYRDIAIDENDNLIAVPRKGAGENTKFFREMEILAKYRFGISVDCFNLSNIKIDYAEVEQSKQMSYLMVDRAFIDNKKNKYEGTNKTFFNILNKNDQRNMAQYIVNILSGEEAIEDVL